MLEIIKKTKTLGKMLILLVIISIVFGNFGIEIIQATNDGTLENDIGTAGKISQENETITVTGRFNDTKGDPIVNYSVKVYNSVSGPDELLAKDLTNENGSFFLKILLPEKIEEGFFLGLFNESKSYSDCYYQSELPTNVSNFDLGGVIVDTGKSTMIDRGDSVIVEGSFEFADDEGDAHPIKYAEGKVKDDIIGGIDTTLANFHTGSDGSYRVCIRDPFFGQHYDIYVFVESEDALDRVEVKDNDLVFKDLYKVQTNTVQNVGAGETVPFDVESPSTSTTRKAFYILDTIQKSHDFVYYNTKTREWVGEVDVIFPHPDTEYIPGSNNIHVESENGFNTYKITHEYGHAVMDYLYGIGSSGPGDVEEDHDFWSDYNRGHAFEEGWAEFFGYLMNNKLVGIQSDRGENDYEGVLEYHKGFDTLDEDYN
ncbi:MAG: hypothetical protein R6U61_03760, partial [Thermoplasmata archaeon]